MAVAAMDGAAIVAVPGLPDMAVHIPPPDAPMVALPPGSVAQDTTLSGPAIVVLTMTFAVSVQREPLVHTKRYTPAVVKPVIKVLADDGAVILAGPGLPGPAVQCPAFIACISAEPPM